MPRRENPRSAPKKKSPPKRPAKRGRKPTPKTAATYDLTPTEMREMLACAKEMGQTASAFLGDAVRAYVADVAVAKQRYAKTLDKIESNIEAARVDTRPASPAPADATVVPVAPPAAPRHADGTPCLRRMAGQDCGVPTSDPAPLAERIVADMRAGTFNTAPLPNGHAPDTIAHVSHMPEDG